MSSRGRGAVQAALTLRTNALAPVLAALNHIALIAAHVRTLGPVWRFLLALVAGGASAGALAPLHGLPVLFVTLPLFVWLIDGAGEGARGVRRAGVAGFAFGFGFFLCGLYWIGFAFLVDSDQFAWMIPFVAVLLPAGLGLFPAFTAAFARLLFWSTGPARVFAFAGLWSLSEWLRGHVLTGFPWNLLGYGWAKALPMLQMSAYVGIYGLSLVTTLAAASFALLGDSEIAPQKRLRIPLAFLAALAILFAFGLARLDGVQPRNVEGVWLRIVQARVDQALIADSTMGGAIFTRYLSLSSEPGLNRVTHIVWPEAGIPFPLEESREAQADIASALGKDTVLLTGTPRLARNADGTALDVFNSMAIVMGGAIVATYDKSHLVPFGEYLPMQRFLERLGLAQLTGNLGSFARGPGARTLAIPGAPPVGPLICYEIIFPNAAVDGAHRPAWLVNLTDDSWFGNGAGPLQHFDAARVRAIEEGLPVVRAANKGVAAIIGPKGEMVAKSPQGAVGALDGPLPMADPATPYARVGDLPYAILLGAVLIIGLSFPRRSRH